MSETNNQSDSPSANDLATPWQILLSDVEQNATVIAEEIMADPALGESVATSVFALLAQRDKLAVLRKKFAEADLLCSDLRKEAGELMRSLGYDFDWDREDISAVDEQVASRMRDAAEQAAAINKKRAEANSLENELLDRAVDEIALCASVAVLRQMNRFTGEGEAFCVAYIAMSILRERELEDLPMWTEMGTLTEWLQYSIGVKPRNVELDIYANRGAAGIGKGLGIENSNALRLALIYAMM